jgi:hypothetical protein
MKLINIGYDQEVYATVLLFDDGTKLYGEHDQDCCECHYLDFEHLELSDFDGLEFDLSNESFFERVSGYGIRLLPKNGLPIAVPGYGSNNGYYSSNIRLVVCKDGCFTDYDVTECQDISWD